MEELRNRLGNPYRVFVVFFIISIFLPTVAFPEEIYEFERMWPTLQQPWYFMTPIGTAFDENGNTFISDRDNNYVLKLSPDGHFLTKFGGYGWAEGQIRGPHGIAVGGGHIYVTSYYHIHKFTTDGQFVLRWGGQGSADGQFFFPRGVATDQSGNIYVADTNNHRIQKFDTNGIFLTKWGSEGSEDGQFQFPEGIAVDADGFVYVFDTGNHRIQKFDSSGTFITKWGSEGSGDGQFYLYQDHGALIAVDSAGYVYVADTRNNRIQKFNSEGLFISKWGEVGSGDGQLWLPSSVAVDHNGIAIVADMLNFRIQKFDSSGTFITKWGSAGIGPGEFSNPRAVTTDSQGYVYVADSQNDRIQKISPNGDFVSVVVNSGIDYPEGIAVDAQGYIYVETSESYIKKFDSSGVFETMWGGRGAGDGQFNYLWGICTDISGNIYAVDRNNHRIQKFDSDGTFLGKWGSFGAGDGQFNEPWGIAFADGYVYVSDNVNKRIQKFDVNGNFIGKWATENRPNGIDTDGSGNVYVTLMNQHRIQKFDSNGTLISELEDYGTNPGQMNLPFDLAVNKDGAVFVADSYNHRIQMFHLVAMGSSNKAIIVAGGGPYPGNNLWDSTQLCSNFAYKAMTYQGFTKSSIYYLSSDTDLDLDNNSVADDVDGDATNSNLQQAITTWASDAEDLILYLVDHGGDGTFRMSGTETLSASDLDTWLDQLQAVIAGKMMVVYDACESGSFLTSLTPPAGKDRIVITSTSPSESAYFVTQGSVSFSNFFWTHVFNGVSVKDAFDLSSQAIGYATDYQTPLIDANGNGFGNEPEDLTLAQNIYIGNGTVIHGEVPLINAVSAPQTIVDTNSALLYADGVTDADGIARVWAVIRPPDYSAGSATNPVQELPSIDLMPVSSSRFEAAYDGFSIEGTYQIAVYARDRIGNTAIPILTTVSVNNPLRRKAIIVAGGPSSDALWSSVQTNAGLVYETLIFQGYSDDDIYFFSPVTFSVGVDGLATLSNLNFAIVTWAATNTRDVVLYLVGRGGAQTFQLNATESLTPADLDTWLDSLQNSLPGNVTIVYDAAHSGSFLNFLAPPLTKERIVISSADNNQSASFISDGDISFSTFFWQQVFNGANVRDAFVHGVNAIDYAAGGQTPLLDDSGNGIGNELGIDGRKARDHTIGVGIMLAGDAPMIGSVSPAQTIGGPVSALLWADDVTTTAAIERVWAVITPPGYDANQSDGSNLARVNSCRYWAL